MEDPADGVVQCGAAPMRGSISLIVMLPFHHPKMLCEVFEFLQTLMAIRHVLDTMGKWKNMVATENSPLYCHDREKFIFLILGLRDRFGFLGANIHNRKRPICTGMQNSIAPD